MKLTRKQIDLLNNMARVDITRALAIIGGINDLFGTEFDILNRRVVFYEIDPKHAYKTSHDAYAYAD